MPKQLPSKTKYRKWHKGRIKGKATKCNRLAFGEFGVQSLERGLLTASQLEAVRVAINRELKRKGKVFLRVFPQKPVTKKPSETRMGKGKGPVEFWAAVIKPGTMICEILGVPISEAREAARKAERKLPFRCRFVSLEELEAY